MAREAASFLTGSEQSPRINPRPSGENKGLRLCNTSEEIYKGYDSRQVG
jgi:hypothetical protein